MIYFVHKFASILHLKVGHTPIQFFENNLESIIIYGDFSISKANTKVSDIDELISLLENIKKNITQ